MQLTEVEVADQKRKLFARVDSSVVDRVKDEAERRFQGNDSMVIREALVTYLDLRDKLGSRYDIVIESLIGDREAAVA